MTQITEKRELKNVPLGDLIPYARNPRKNAPAVQQVAASLKEYGLVKNSIVVDEDMTLITGHTTLKAMQSLGWTVAPEVTQVFGLTAAQKKAYRIADNRLGELAEWDADLLALEFDDLKELDFNIDLTGFDDAALAEMYPPEKLEVVEDDYEPPVEIEISIQRGDLFRLGRHRLLCGDSTSAEDVARLMGGAKADICFTSPPYNAGSLNIKGQVATGAKYLETSDDLNDDEYVGFLDSVVSNALIAADDAMINIGLVEGNKRAIIRILNLYIDNFKDIVYWKKSTCAPHIQPGVINNQIEFILCFGDGKRRFKSAQFHQGTYWNVIEGPPASSNEYAKIHKATFPVYLPANIIENFCPPEGEVFDPFLGSGTTLVACEQLGRTCYGMEISPQYCQVIVDRWEKLTGQKAERVNDPDECRCGGKVLRPPHQDNREDDQGARPPEERVYMHADRRGRLG